MESSGANEATVKGNKEVIEDLFRQLELTDDEIEHLAVLISLSGDQMTAARVRALKHNLKKMPDKASSFPHVFMLVELWHMKHAFLNGIFKTHWASTISKGDFGLRSWPTS